MDANHLEIHSVYGAIPHSGDHVEAGEVIGLSPDGTSVVTAPESGQVHLLTVKSPGGHRLFVKISGARAEAAPAHSSARTA